MDTWLSGTGVKENLVPWNWGKESWGIKVLEPLVGATRKGYVKTQREMES